MKLNVKIMNVNLNKFTPVFLSNIFINVLDYINNN